MHNFTPLRALIGGVLIGTAASGALYVTGRIAGISGIVGGLLPGAGQPPVERRWRAWFAAGLLCGGLALLAATALAPAGHPPALIGAPIRSWSGLVAAGLLVGFGARLGRGCTSGHGVCGISRLSGPSMLATVVFMATGMITAVVVRAGGWFLP